MARGSSPHSLTSSPPAGYKVKYASDDDPSRETDLFQDTLVLNSPFTETEYENLNLDTEILEDSEPAEDMTTGKMCEYGQVVLDSEDEEMDDRHVGKEFLEDETSPTVKIPSILFQKRQPKPPCEQVEASTTTFGSSAAEHNMLEGDKRTLVDSDSFDDGNRLYPPATLNHIHSPEFGDSTQAALGFVDQYLSSNDVDLFQGVHRGKTAREKSPHVLNARGPLNLAKKIKARTKNEEKEPFKLVDSCQHDNRGRMFSQKSEASSNFGRYKQTYTRTKKGGHLNCSTSNTFDGKLGQGPRMAIENDNSLKEFNVHPSSIRENADVYSGETHIEDMSDIGLGTQIAAEAMNALALMPPYGCQFNDTHQPENALDGSLSDLTENEAHLNNSSNIQNPSLRSITTKSNKKNASSSRFSKITYSSSCKDTDKQESNVVSDKMKKRMKGKSTAEGRFENNNSLPVCSKHVLLEEVCPPGEYTSFEPAAEESEHRNNESGHQRIKDQPSLRTEENNNDKEKGIKHKRKETGLEADPVKLGARTKRLKFLTDSCILSKKVRLNHLTEVSPELSATRSFSWTDSWVYPKRSRGKRKGANMGTKLNATTVLCTDGKENNVFSTRSIEDQANASCVDDGGCLLQGDFVPPGSSGDAMKVQNWPDMHPLFLAHVERASNRSVAQSRSGFRATVVASEGVKVSNVNHSYTEHHKKLCVKTLPKSSLLKELIRLGVPESMSDMMWKDLRHRRDMTDVRVLFSQHLDDSIIKQQKKILKRLNISVASCSMEATHFVADKFTRTKNMLEAMALGKLVVNHLWLESCGQANCFIDEKNYILRDMKKEKEIGFNMAVSLARARQEPLLKGKRVYITPHIKPDKEVIASLVTAVHGQVVDQSEVCADMNDKILDDLLILSCEDDYAICHRLFKRGTAVYSSELVLHGIVIQKLELERHQLFMSQVTRSSNCPSTSNRFGKVYRRRRGLILDCS
ncbi:hypothetical protein PHAVU_001G201700 [Phaseolus vulgaris]|uniref:BRCT domain-containing protein n=2 Tax=Phaseolus vulgaris TaxID=3885 RepID=V7D064_PHAVU|nr:hypothetical protein PHAVU_001G201700g [Phaseolus vulgaris]ESW35043.1 hypothetical protein PHAVU_001G201700g [Phaseolus vulgaris]